MLPNRASSFYMPLLLAAILAVGMLLGYNMRRKVRYHGEKGKLEEILSLVKENYVDKVDTDSIKTLTIDKLLASLDPHSVYIPPQDLIAADDDLDGDFDGIGIEFSIQRDTLVVTNVIANGPSATAGLQNGDKIISVNDTAISGKELNASLVFKKLRGMQGTKVKVGIVRNAKLLPPITITRGKIPLYSIDAAYMLNNATAYIRINKFGAQTYEEFMQKLSQLQKQGMQNLVLDLRDNPGGFLESAVAILDEFIDGKKRMVYTKDRQQHEDSYYSTEAGRLHKNKIAVLVNEGSASAAEITSGVIQDFDRGIIIGRRTFGKGLVQQEFKLSTGGGIRLTTARYYIASGRCIQKDYSKGSDEYDNDIEERYHSGELSGKDTTKQYKGKAFKTLSGRTVYEGGGIEPDIFVPLDTLVQHHGLIQLVTSGIINNVANEYTVLQRATLLQQYKDAKQFAQSFNVPQDLIQKVIADANQQKITSDTWQNKQRMQFINTRLKGLIAKVLYGQDAQYMVENMNDPFIQIAIKNLQ